ncbi:hypothetical protein BGZ63DRAFT_428361 [Mariannaea sp. PMI_226]|nr:hypothetical protein BGZ63DRAFT_428361 [Mariannaea sp. PMI_226]
MNSPAISRACESCRLLKVRCRPRSGPGDAPRSCERCAASGKDCFYSAPRRTRKKRTDVRVRELEQEMASLTGLLKAQQQQQQVVQKDSSSPSDDAILVSSSHLPSQSSQHQSHTGPMGTTASTLSFNLNHYDPISLGLLTVEEASGLFQHYIDNLVPKRPFVVFAPGTNAEQVRKNQPTLFLAVLAAAAGTRNEALGMRLNEMIFSVYADQIMMQGEKSLELIKAILITTNWYCPPSSYEKLKFYQFVHIAATMCVDIGLGELVASSIEGTSQDDLLDGCRVMLACYICCSSISINFHRQNMFPFTNRIAGCLAALESSAARFPTDAAVVAGTRLQLIVDHESARPLGFRDSAVSVDLSKPEVQASLLGCSNKLRMWNMSIPTDTMSAPLLMQYFAMTCLANEVGLHFEYSPDDFKPPYVIHETTRVHAENSILSFTPNHLDCIINCVSAAQSSCDTFIAMSTEYIQCLPIATYARLGYALVVLVKVSVSTHSANGALKGIMPPETTRADQYLEQVVAKLSATGISGCRAAVKWLEVIESIADWFQLFLSSAADGVNGRVDVGILEPLKHLNLTIGTANDNRGNSSAYSVQPRQATSLSYPDKASEPQVTPTEMTYPNSTDLDHISLSPNTLSILAHDDLAEFVNLPITLDGVDFEMGAE